MSRLYNLTIYLFIMVFISSTVCSVALATFEDFVDGDDNPQYMTVLTDAEEELFVSGSQIYVGDQYQSSDDKMYEIYKVEETRAYAKFLYNVDLAAIPIPKVSDDVPVQQPTRKIGIYQTHSSESFVPTDGTESNPGAGGILEVGSSLAERLKEKGVNAIFSDAKHEPHDSGAYRRSRRTATDILKENVDAVIDVHRDAVPAEAYLGNAGGTDIAKIRFVVGRQNPNMVSNQKFAQGLKKLADQMYPGLVKDIFFGKGSYNQDLSPRAMLIEAGAHTVSQDRAEKGATLFADVLSQYIYGDAAAGQPAADQNTGAGGTLAWILGLAALGGVVFVLLNAGSFGEVTESLRNFGKKQYSSSLADLEKLENDIGERKGSDDETE